MRSGIKTTIMADKPVPLQMMGKGDITVGTADGLAAGSADI
jgi:hypothetical protein